uniref:Peroxin-13 n=1 Tax=Ananas comosus var. bracteatus TaxID=296719 RepID=A0A6V7NNA1_ANACO|nr:unnamed protein product [Ananas comosus var. bracteatus]
MAPPNPDSSRPGNPPQKPWEKAGSSPAAVPFRPPSSGSTSEVVEASGTAKAGERNAIVNRNIYGGPIPLKPWEQNNRNYGSGMYSRYGGGLHGGSGWHRRSMYNNGSFSAHRWGRGPYGDRGLNDPNMPSSPPGFFISFLRVVHGCVNYFGDILGLIDQNTEAFHMLITALLQFLDGTSLLYGNLSRFVFGLLGIRTRHIKNSQTGTSESAASRNEHGKQCVEGPKNESSSWDNVWGSGP